MDSLLDAKVSRNSDYRGGAGYRPPYPLGSERYPSEGYGARSWDRPGPSDRDFRERSRYQEERGWGSYNRDRYMDRDRQSHLDSRTIRADYRNPSEYEGRERRRYVEEEPRRAYDRDDRQREYTRTVQDPYGGRRETDGRDYRMKRPSPGPRNDSVASSSHPPLAQRNERVDPRYAQPRANYDDVNEQSSYAGGLPPDTPTGPRRSLAGPPTQPGSARDSREFVERASVSASQRPSYDGVNLRLQPQERIPVSSQSTDRSPHSAASAEGASSVHIDPRKSISHRPLHAQVLSGSAPISASNSTPTTPTEPNPTIVAGKRIRWDEKELRGSVAPKIEAEAYSQTLNRIRSFNAVTAQVEFQNLRKALHDVADSDVELAGARNKAALTEDALERAKEQAEAWSIESGRLELEYRNKGSQAYWTTSSAAANG